MHVVSVNDVCIWTQGREKYVMCMSVVLVRTRCGGVFLTVALVFACIVC